MESRLLDEEGQHIVADNFQIPTEIRWRELSASTDEGIYYKLNADLVLIPGKKYLLEFEFNDALDYAGTLRFEGSHLFREYTLPYSGEDKAFGSKSGSSHVLVLWTVLNTPEEIRVSFIRPSVKPVQSLSAFGRYRFAESIPALRPIETFDLIPYRSHVRALAASWVETPRMYLRGYQAIVNGKPSLTRASPQGLVMFQVPRGESLAELRYIAPKKVILSGWISGTSWLSVVGMFLLKALRSKRRNSSHFSTESSQPISC